MAVELALDENGTFLGLRIEKSASVGAYLNNFGPLPAFGNLGGIAGVYTTPAISACSLASFVAVLGSTPLASARASGSAPALQDVPITPVLALTALSA